MVNGRMPRAAPLPVGQVLAATTSTQALSTLGVLALAAIAPRAAADLGLPASVIGYQVSVVYGAAMLTALFGGAMVRRLGGTRTCQAALVLVAGGALLSALATAPAVALGALVIGCGYGLTNPAASHLLSRAPASRNMNLLFSLKQSGVPLGGVLAGAMLPPLTIAYGWRTALVACALLVLALAALLATRARAWDADRDRAAPLFVSPLASLALVWRHDVLRWIGLSSFAYSAVQLCLIGFLVTYLVAAADLELVAAGTVLSLTHAAGAVGRPAWGWIADRLRSGSLALAVNGGLSVPGALAMSQIDAAWPLWATAAVCMLFGFCAMGWNGVFVAVVARQAPAGQVGVATGGTIGITYAGVLIVPAAFAAAHERLGLPYDVGYALLALISAAGVAAVMRARRYAVKATPPRAP
jgi:MFS family permease